MNCFDFLKTALSLFAKLLATSFLTFGDRKYGIGLRAAITAVLY